MRIGIDLMGSDQPPHILFEAVSSLSTHHQTCTFVVFAYGFEAKMPHNVTLVTTPEFIEMDENPLTAVRKKRKSTMAVGINMLRERNLDAFVSAGNTGALVATARLHLKLLPTLTTCALLVLMPKEGGHLAVLDVGANTAFKPPHFLEYARLGSAYMKVGEGIAHPNVFLLNTGVEKMKGTEEIRQAHALLSAQLKGFAGNIEGREVFSKNVDVLVTEGFTGNIFLKTCEGVSSFLFDFLKERMEGEKRLLSFKKQFNYSAHPGGILCGVEGLVVKCHGASDAQAFASGIEGAIDLARRELVEKMRMELECLSM